MRGAIVGWLIGFGFATNGLSWAQEPGVVTPEELEQGQAIERNTYRDEQYGFSITKPEDWVLLSPEEIPPSFRGPLMQLPPDAPMTFLGKGRCVVRFPLDAGWVLVNPFVCIEIYQSHAPLTNEQVINDFLLSEQRTPEIHARVAISPAPVEINGKNWAKAATLVDLFVETPPTQFEAYREVYAHTSDNKVFLIHFEARVADVPLSRQDVNGIVQSIQITAHPQPRPGVRREL